ncbi:hypothetical protein BP6252_08338 [Coleophoma cylindrospora]|uniref:Uncharacterized protein n=1 Tax=Coleophoma cylindrospora TaxID=1849047 RepID=A0A3D8R5T3_9HELO|nr:hypothetical protein BP6252_08338 [Coleophoma cylindrospora]
MKESMLKERGSGSEAVRPPALPGLGDAGPSAKGRADAVARAVIGPFDGQMQEPNLALVLGSLGVALTDQHLETARASQRRLSDVRCRDTLIATLPITSSHEWHHRLPKHCQHPRRYGPSCRPSRLAPRPRGLS